MSKCGYIIFLSTCWAHVTLMSSPRTEIMAGAALFNLCDWEYRGCGILSFIRVRLEIMIPGCRGLSSWLGDTSRRWSHRGNRYNYWGLGWCLKWCWNRTSLNGYRNAPCLHNWYLESSQIEGKTCDLWGEGRIVLSPIKWRDSRVPSDVIVLRGLEFLAVFLFNIERLELETVFWYRQLVGGVGQRDTLK